MKLAASLRLPLGYLFVVAVFLGLNSSSPGQKPGVEQAMVFKGHTEPVYSVALTPDNRYLVTGSFDTTVKLWDLATGKEVKTYGGTNGHTKMVTCVAVSPDGSALATGSADNTLRFWDLPINAPIKSYPLPEAAQRLALSADGTKLALGAATGKIVLVNPADFKETGKFDASTVSSLAWNATGSQLVSGGTDGNLRFINPAKNETITVGAHRGAVQNAVVNAAANNVISVGDDGQMRFWTVPPTPAKVLPTNTIAVVASALAGDQQTLLLAGADKNIRMLSAATAKELRILTGATAEILATAINPANTLVAAALADGRWTLWNATDGKSLGSLLAHAGKINTLAFPAQNPHLATGGADGFVKFWSMPPVPARVAPHSAEVIASLATADGKKLITAAGDKAVRIFETGKMTLEKQFPPQSAPITTLATADKAIVTGGGDGLIRFWNPATGKEAETLAGHSAAITALATVGTAGPLLSTSEDGTVKAWQLPLVQPKPMIHPDQVTGLALSGDPSRVFTAGADRIVRLWGLGDSSKVKEYAGPTLAITALAASVDGRFLAAVSADKSLHLWTAADAKVANKWVLPTVANAVAFSPDNQKVAVGLADSTVKIFKTSDFKDPKEIKSFPLAKGGITSLAYLPKGDLLLVGCADKVIVAVAPADGAVKNTLNHVGPLAQIVLSKDATKVAGIAGKVAKLWSLADGKELASINLPAEGKSISLSPDATRLAVAGADRFVRLFQADGTLLEMFPHEGPVHGVHLLDGKKLVSVSADKTARLWNSALLWQKSHAGPVRHAVLSPKGDVFFSAGDDKTVKLWNVADGKELRSMPAHDGPILRVAISPDATKLASLGAEKSIKLWNLAGKAEDAGKPVAVFPFAQPPSALALNLAGQYLAVGLGNEVKVIDVALGKETQTFQDHTAPVHGLTFLADQKTLLTASKDQSAKLLSVAVLGALEGHPGGVTSLHYLPNNQLLTAGADKTIKIWDLTKREVVKSFGPLPDPIHSASTSRDGLLVVAATGKQLRLWNLADGKELPALPHPADVRSFSFKADKTRVLTGCDDKQTRLWDLTTAKELQWSTFAEPVSAVYLEPNGPTFMISVAGKSCLLETPSIQRVIPTDAGPTYALAIAATNFAFTGGVDKTIRAWNLGNMTQEKTTFPPMAGTIRALAVAKSNLLLAAGGDDKIIRLISLPDGKELASAPVDGPVKSLQFSINNTLLIAQLADNKVLAFSVSFTPGQPLPSEFMKVAQAFAPPQPLGDLVLTADNATFYAPAADKTVQLWRIASPNPVKSLPHPNTVDCIAFHPKLPLAATGCHDGNIRIWDLSKNALLKAIPAHVDKTNPNAIYTIAYSPDGTKLLSSSYDRSVKISDATSGALIREFKPYHEKDFPKGHMDEVYAASFSPDGQFVASASGGLEKVIKIWNANDGSVVRDLINPALPNLTKQPPASHPGWIYHLRYLKDGRLLSLGDAPKNQGFIAVWNPNDGKLLQAETTTFGALFGFAISADEKLLAVGTGARGRATGDLNQGYLLRVPGVTK